MHACFSERRTEDCHARMHAVVAASSHRCPHAIGMHVASQGGAHCHHAERHASHLAPHYYRAANIARSPVGRQRGRAREEATLQRAGRRAHPASRPRRTRVGLCACHYAFLARIRGNLRNMLDRTPLARVLAIHNGKGGAIKTSIATNLPGSSPRPATASCWSTWTRKATAEKTWATPTRPMTGSCSAPRWRPGPAPADPGGPRTPRRHRRRIGPPRHQGPTRHRTCSTCSRPH